VQGGIIEKKLENVDAVYTNKFVADFNRFDVADIAKRAKAWRDCSRWKARSRRPRRGCRNSIRASPRRCCTTTPCALSA